MPSLARIYFSSRFFFPYTFVAMVALSTMAFLFREFYCGNVQLWQVAFFIGTCLLVIGWITTSEVAITNSRKQHTISLLTEYLFNSVHEDDGKTIREKLPMDQKLTADVADFDKPSDLVASIARELNFLEFFAVAYKHRDIDRRLFEGCMKSLVKRGYERCEVFIKHRQSSQPTAWEHLTSLYNYWYPDGQSQKKAN